VVRPHPVFSPLAGSTIYRRPPLGVAFAVYYLSWPSGAQLAARAVAFIDDVATARLVRQLEQQDGLLTVRHCPAMGQVLQQHRTQKAPLSDRKRGKNEPNCSITGFNAQLKNRGREHSGFKPSSGLFRINRTFFKKKPFICTCSDRPLVGPSATEVGAIRGSRKAAPMLYRRFM